MDNIHTYFIPRFNGYEDKFMELYNYFVINEYLDLDECPYENKIFKIQAYKNKSCNCTYRKRFHEIMQKNKKFVPKCFKAEHEYFNKLIPKFSKEDLKKLLKLFDDDYIFNGRFHSDSCGVNCNCEFYQKFTMQVRQLKHDDDCFLSESNFIYKPFDFKIKWYQYPLNNGMMNQNLDFKSFNYIIDHCSQSLGMSWSPFNV
jgi:hypothetical protein